MKVINCQTLGEMCEHMLDGEPVFLMRAQDMLSLKILQEYLTLSLKEGGKNTGRVRSQVDKFIKWQLENKHKVKLPD